MPTEAGQYTYQATYGDPKAPGEHVHSDQVSRRPACVCSLSLHLLLVYNDDLPCTVACRFLTAAADHGGAGCSGQAGGHSRPADSHRLQHKVAHVQNPHQKRHALSQGACVDDESSGNDEASSLFFGIKYHLKPSKNGHLNTVQCMCVREHAQSLASGGVFAGPVRQRCGPGHDRQCAD